MTIKYLIDENLPPLYQQQLLRYQPGLTVLMVGEPATPPKVTLDPEILIWCELNNFILATNNGTSMPIHLAEHLRQNRHIPGILFFRRKSTIGQIINDLILIAEVKDYEAFKNCITHIPL
jgi:ribosomal protein L39E